MKVSTYWLAYKLAMTKYILASFDGDCDGMARYLKSVEKLDEQVTAAIEKLELLERQGEIE